MIVSSTRWCVWFYHISPFRLESFRLDSISPPALNRSRWYLFDLHVHSPRMTASRLLIASDIMSNDSPHNSSLGRTVNIHLKNQICTFFGCNHQRGKGCRWVVGILFEKLQNHIICTVHTTQSVLVQQPYYNFFSAYLIPFLPRTMPTKVNKVNFSPIVNKDL